MIALGGPKLKLDGYIDFLPPVVVVSMIALGGPKLKLQHPAAAMRSLVEWTVAGEQPTWAAVARSPFFRRMHLQISRTFCVDRVDPCFLALVIVSP